MRCAFACTALLLAGNDAAAGPEVRAYIDLGATVPMLAYTDYGPALPIAAGMELTASRSHRFIALAEYGRFSGEYLVGPLGGSFAIDGLTLDAATALVAWRCHPIRRAFVGLGTGVTVVHDQIRMQLPDREVVGTQTRAGVPFEVAVGWMWNHRIDTTFNVRVTPLAGDGPTTMASFDVSVGVRL